jgi:hypothetical protein
VLGVGNGVRLVVFELRCGLGCVVLGRGWCGIDILQLTLVDITHCSQLITGQVVSTIED